MGPQTAAIWIQYLLLGEYISAQLQCIIYIVLLDQNFCNSKNSKIEFLPFLAIKFIYRWNNKISLIYFQGTTCIWRHKSLLLAFAL